MELGLSGKVCIVTGSTRGIGYETARLLALEGASVVTCGRGEDPGIAGAVHIADSLKRRARRHQVGPFDLDVGRGKIDLVGPPRVDGKKRHVPSSGFDRIEHLARRIEGNDFDRQLSSSTKLPRQIHRYAGKLPAGSIAPREHGIAVVDTDVQLALWRQLGTQ